MGFRSSDHTLRPQTPPAGTRSFPRSSYSLISLGHAHSVAGSSWGRSDSDLGVRIRCRSSVLTLLSRVVLPPQDRAAHGTAYGANCRPQAVRGRYVPPLLCQALLRD